MVKTVVAFGSFDVLHPGHVFYLRSASKYGKLTVVVARDDSIRKLKGIEPFIDEQSRVELVGALRFVDKAVLGNMVTSWNEIYNILKKLKPDYIVFGYDQRVDMKYLKAFLKRNGLSPRIIRIRSFDEGRYKSSKLKRLIKG